MTLPGLTSRWTMPAAWPASRASSSSVPMAATSAGGSGPERSTSSARVGRVDQLHHDQGPAVVLHHVVDGDRPGMVEPGRGPCLPQDGLPEIGLRTAAGHDREPDLLDGHIAVQQLVAGPPHHPRRTGGRGPRRGRTGPRGAGRRHTQQPCLDATPVPSAYAPPRSSAPATGSGTSRRSVRRSIRRSAGHRRYRPAPSPGGAAAPTARPCAEPQPVTARSTAWTSSIGWGYQGDSIAARARNGPAHPTPWNNILVIDSASGHACPPTWSSVRTLAFTVQSTGFRSICRSSQVSTRRPDARGPSVPRGTRPGTGADDRRRPPSGLRCEHAMGQEGGADQRGVVGVTRKGLGIQDGRSSWG